MRISFRYWQIYNLIFYHSPCGAGVYKNMLTVWSLRVVGSDRRVQGSWVGDPLPVSLFSILFSRLFFVPYERINGGLTWGDSFSLPWCFCLPFCLFFVPYERINCWGWGAGFRPLCLDPFSFHFRSLLLSFLSPFLALMRVDPAVAGLGYSIAS